MAPSHPYVFVSMSGPPLATHAFFRDVLESPFVEQPDTPGWLIFKPGPSELGVHPTTYTWEGESTRTRATTGSR